VWLAAEIGVEGSALDNLKAYVGGHRINSLTSSNLTRLGEATSDKAGDLVATPKQFEVYDGLSARLLRNIHGQLDANASSTRSRALTDAAIILVALLASLLLALFIARALIVPLRKVRAGTLDVANVTLPETVARIRSGKEPDEIVPIPVHSREELGQLARAVDDMHKQAVNLATGEAQLRSQVGAMFVTLSRRNTTLVNQQLALIESLEQDEEDPQRLEQLFSLDHLATRMRRTAESLVILGGAPGRTAGFEELSVSDVVHAAVSEVQDYQRVRIDAAPDRMIVGRAASDVVHLMAELIDNALSYSPPGSPVTIAALEDEDKVEIQVIDSGLGMAGDALAQANESLKSGGEVTIDTARRMGLFVVSRLAEEHGLRVKLRRNTNGGGIIASIILPPAVLVGSEPVEHVSLLDAPEEPEELVEPVVEEPDEEYDPYLERIEEAIAAVTGLPRRRPGVTPGPAQEAPAANVGMFEAKPALPPGFEPTELPGVEEPVATATAQAEPVATALDGPATWDRLDESDEEPLAKVVTPVFGGERHEPTAESESLEEIPQDDPWVADDQVEALQHLAEPEQPEPVEVDALTDEPSNEPVPVEDAEESEPLEALEPVEAVDTEPLDTEPAADEVPAEPVPATGWQAPADEGWAATAPAYDEPTVVAEAEEPAYAAPEPVVAKADEVPAEVPEAPVRLQIRRPLSATPAASSLVGDFVPEHNETEDSTIFGQLRSNWLSDDEDEAEEAWAANEVDRGFDAAQHADSAEAEGTTRTGLPVRRPGGRLVPGGVSQEPSKVVRDPEAIRNRLAAHAAGVSRGRAAAAAEPITDDYAHEETGPA
jgi:signal transduction histidine kinase